MGIMIQKKFIFGMFMMMVLFLGACSSGSVTDATQSTVPQATSASSGLVALPQSLSLNEDAYASVVLEGTGQNLTYIVTKQPASGMLTGTPPNMTYTPKLNFNGQDSFSFVVSNGVNISQENVVNLTVLPVNDAPIAVASVFLGAENQVLTGTLDAIDIDGDALTYSIVDNATTKGTLVLINPRLGTFSYTPYANMFGQDTFTFNVSDGIATSATVAVSVTTQNINNAPVASSKNIVLAEDTYSQFTLIGSDLDANPLQFIVTSLPLHGTLSGTLPNMTYTPASNFNGQDSLKFYASDGGLNSLEATVSFSVTPVNDAPVANNATITLNQGTSATFVVGGSDLENDPLTYQISTSPALGNVLLGSQSGTVAGMSGLQYVPSADFYGQDQIIFDINDGKGGVSQGTVSFQVLPFAQSTQDSDGDGLSDAVEIVKGTNPLLADTDGDGFNDFDEIVTHAFNASVNNLRFNPLIADTPKIKIDITSPPDFALNYTYDTGATTSVSTNNVVTQGTSLSTSSGTEQSQTYDYTNSIGAEVSVGYSGGAGSNAGTFSVEATASYGHEETVGQGSSVSFSTENVVENSRTLEQAQAFESSSGLSVTDGDIDVTVQITNPGYITYTLNNLTLSAFTAEQSPTGIQYGSVGTMLFTDAFLTAFPATTLTPGVTTTQLNFTAGGNDVALMKSLMADSRSLTVKPATYNLLDQNGVPYAFNATNIGTQTANIIVDYAGSAGRNTLKESVAVHGSPSQNISLLDALDKVLRLNPVITDAYGSVSTQGSLHSIDGIAANGQYAYWLLIHGAQQGNGQMVTTVYTTPDEVARWKARSQGLVTNLVGDFDPATIALNAGDIVHLVYMQDEDLDGLSNLQEFTYGTDPLLQDTDFDGIQDSVEVKGWDVAYTDEFLIDRYTHVYSNPTLLDTDADGLTDDVEANLTQTNPFLRRNPSSSDTDGDGIPDGSDDYAGAVLAANVFDSMKIKNMSLTRLPVAALGITISRVSFLYPAILADVTATGFSTYDVYLLKKVYAAGSVQANPALDSMPFNTVFKTADTLSCRNNAPADDPNCSWTVAAGWSNTRQVGTGLFQVTGTASSTPTSQLFDDWTPVPAGGSIQYRFLIAVDGEFQSIPGDLAANATADIIEITMKPGSYSQKQTLLGQHGRILGQNTFLPYLEQDNNLWTNSVGKIAYDEASQSHLIFTDRIWFVGGVVNSYYNRYSTFGTTPYPEFVHHVNPAGVFAPFVGAFTYASTADFQGFQLGTEVGDGQLDLQFELLFDGAGLFTPVVEPIDGTLQPERLNLATLSGATQVTPVTGVAYDIFTRFNSGNDLKTGIPLSGGVFQKEVTSATPGGACHTILYKLNERNTLQNKYQRAKHANGEQVIKLCPSSTTAREWTVDVNGYRQRTILRQNNAASTLVVNLDEYWRVSTQGSVQTTMEIRIK